MTSPDRFAVLFGPDGFADRTPGLPGPPDITRRSAVDAEDLLRDLGSPDLGLVVVHHARLDILPALRPAMAPVAGARLVPILVVGCPGAAGVDEALAAGADLAVREDAGASEVASLGRAALDLCKLQFLSLKDDLTLAWNRRFFDRCLDPGLDSARAQALPLSLIFMDLDNLKAVNLRHGHATGSHILREVAARLIAAVRATDAVMRYGGDEFCVLLPGLATAGALEVAERLRDAVSSRPFDVQPSGQVSLTASFGIATFPDHASDARALVAAADAAMLAIKDRQRNGIHVAGPA